MPIALGDSYNPLAFLDPRQPGELRMERMRRVEESLLPVKDRRVAAIGVVMEADPERLKVHGHGSGQRRVRVSFEVRIA